MSLQGVFLAGLAILLIYYVGCILRNYLAARKLGIPIIILPFDNVNPIWLLLAGPLHRLLKRIGIHHLRMGHLGWEFEEKASPFPELGCNALIQVTPGANWLNVAHPAAITQVFQAERRGDVDRGEGTNMLKIFGPNISTASGPDWQRQRKVTAAAFNERTNRVVWAESLKQGEDMVGNWLAAGEAGVRSTADDTRLFAMNIIMRGGFGKAYDFQSNPPSVAKSEDTSSMDYREAMNLIIKNAILIIGIGPDNLGKLGFVSSKLKTLAQAVSTFREHILDMLEQGQKEGKEVESRGNLLDALVRALNNEKELSQSEIMGNSFIYTFGGHDTTAHSLAFTLVLLSVHPEVQWWMREELRRELDGQDSKQWQYDAHSSLKRTLAVQYETVRLYDPVLGIVRAVTKGSNFHMSLDEGKTSVRIPPGTNITLNINAIHTHPQFWGADALEWRPQRWIKTNDNGNEELIVPEKGLFTPWSDGLRVCPGKKFGQVEHLSLMASVFRDHAVEAAAEGDETVAQTKDRIMGVVKDSGMTLNVAMYHPEKAKLVWKRC
ncbi:cytochrome P450 monooxygenase-like protein [Coniochaeta sp. 2T2.1]|nr:cytochrome P450 monooxygenase-like protein [Coniochaeta sp. 2T2.1]